MAEQEYNTALENYNYYTSLNSKCLSWLNMIKDMEQYGFTTNTINDTQIRSQMGINSNLMQQSKLIIDKYERETRNFSLCLLINNEKKAYLCRRIDPTKDYYDCYQATGGSKEDNETFEECAIREAKEEADIDINELIYVDTHIGFRVFPDKKECRYATAIYYSFIEDQIPKHTEPTKHDPWEFFDFKDISKLKLTNSLEIKLKMILDNVNSKYRYKKKRKIQQVNGNDVESRNNDVESKNNDIDSTVTSPEK